MKTTTLTNLLLLTSVALFTACSNKAVEPKKEAKSLNSIIGIQEAVVRVAPSVSIPVIQNTHVRTLPMARTYPIYASVAPIAPVQHHNPVYAMPSIPQHSYISNNLQLTNEIEWSAKQLLGIKYVWGATGPNKYDCSGFTQKIYRDAGINIPRVSRDQARVGQYIAYNNLKRGDMVFFDTKKKRTGIVSHVGIYLDNGNFIHASSAAKKIVIFNFNQKSFYKKRFLWGRRVLPTGMHMASL